MKGIYSDNPTIHINTVRGENAEFLNVKSGGTDSYNILED